MPSGSFRRLQAGERHESGSILTKDADKSGDVVLRMESLII